jgi:hypothetical protein
MSDVTDQYAVVKQTSFVVPGSRSLNKVHLRKNLQFFEVPEGGIESIRSNLTMKIYDEYSDLLRGMYIAMAARAARITLVISPPSELSANTTIVGRVS